MLDPDGKHTLQTYDAFSRVATETQSVQGTLKKTTQTIYDMLSRVTVTTVQDEDLDTTRTTTVAYPAGTGQPPTTVELARPGTTTTIVIDANGRETDRTDVTAAGTITRNVTAFDAANRATSWTRDDVLSGRVFDAAGRVEGQTGEGFGPVGACYVFDASTGRKSYELLMFTYPSTAEYNVYRYGETGRLTQATVAGVTSTYAYEPGTGNLTSRTAGGVTSAFSYDGSSRVTTLAVGGIATRLYGWDATRGLRTSEGPPQNPTERMLTYSDANRLSSIAAPGLSASYAYDAQGQRTSSVVTQGSTTTTTTFSYEGLTLLRLDVSRVEGSTTATWSVTYLADAESRPYAGVYESGTTQLAFGIVTTDRGDVRELTNGAGVPFAFYAHDAYGNPTTTLSRAVTGISAGLAAAIAERNILRYAGYAYDAHSGLYYCSQRYYDPATASFITKDPAKADGEESAYQYCGGDPVGKTDPSGTVWLSAFVAIVSYKVLDTAYQVGAGTCALSHVGCHFGPPPGTMGVPIVWRLRVALRRRYVVKWNLYKWRGLFRKRGPFVGHLYRLKEGWSAYSEYTYSGGLGAAKAYARERRVRADKESISQQARYAPW